MRCVKSSVRVITSAGFLAACAAGALAGPGGYCDDFAKHSAGRKIGLAGALPAASTGDGSAKWKGAYDQAFADCMSSYGAAEVGAVVEPQVQGTKPVRKKEASGCATRYRSFNPKTRKYKSYSGEWRACR